MPIGSEDISKSAQLEEASTAREQQLQLALQAARMVAWEWDPNRNVVTTTDNLTEIYGISTVQMAEQGFAMVHADDVERHQTTVDQAIASCSSYRSEFRIVRPDTGTVVWMEERGTPVLDETGKLQKLVGVVMDITERRQAEESLRLSEGQYRTIVATANEGIWLIDLKATTIYANERMAEMLGYRPEELGQRTVLDCTFPDDEAIHRERIGQNLEGKVEQFDTRFRRKDGAELLVLGCTSPVRDANGTLVGALGMFTDITERVRAEQERLELLARAEQARAEAEEAQRRLSLLAETSTLLAVNNARLYREAQQLAAEQSAILSQMANGVTMVDPAGRVTFMNEAARRLTGDDASGSLESALNRHRITTVDGQPYPLERLPLTRALAHRETVVEAQWRLRRSDGTEIVVQGSAAPVVAEHGALLGAVSTFRDVTEQVTLEQQKEEFLSAAAHDLRTPLTGLKGVAQVLQRRLTRDGDIGREALQEGLARIEQNATRMTSLINELLDLSRLQMGEGLELHRRPMDLVSLVSQFVGENQEAPGVERVSLEILAPDLTGTWDADRLERVLANLLSNAAKYSPHDSPITVMLTREEAAGRAWAVLSVQDRGIGIPPADLPHIFERFYRGRNVGRETLGTGIGLSGAKQIVERHGGTIEVRSQEGAGSTFSVRLPLTE